MNLRKDHLHDVYPLSNQNLTVRLGPFLKRTKTRGQLVVAAIPFAVMAGCHGITLTKKLS